MKNMNLLIPINLLIFMLLVNPFSWSRAALVCRQVHID